MLRTLAWTSGLAAALVVSVVGPFVIPPLMHNMATRSLYQRALAMGKVDATELETGWDRVCVADSYCGGPGDSGPEVCDNLQSDGLWGVVFLHAGKVMSLKQFTGFVRYEGPDGLASCLAIDQRPAFFVTAPNRLTLRPTAK